MKTEIWAGRVRCVLLAALWVSMAGVGQAQMSGERTISAVRLSGLDYVADQEQLIRSKLEVQEGKRFSDAALRRATARDIRRLWDLGYFSRIQADATPEGGGLAVTYIFEEKRIVDEVRIMGSNKVKQRLILGALTMREGDAFAPEATAPERDAVLDLYESKGFANAQVDLVAEPAGPGRVRLLYMIDEGRKARIRSITFVGNEAMTSRALRKTMKTHKALWFMGGKYEEEKLEFDLEQILEEYGDHGRLEADVARTDVTYTGDGKGMDITIYLNEGPEYRVDVLDIAENEVFDDDEILETIKVQSGDVHNAGQVRKDAEAIQSGYRDSGYVNAIVTPQIALDREANTTHVVHKVEEADLKYLKEINITGNSVTKDEIIRRQILLQPGDRYDGGARDATRERIARTGYFDSSEGEPAVRLTLEDDPANERYTNMNVDVEEGKTGTLNFGLGYSTEDQLGGFVEIKRNNFDISNWPTLTGGGQQLSIRLNVGSRRNEYDLSFTNPEFLGYPISMGFDLFNDSYRYTGGANYREERTGGQLRLGKVLSPYVTVRSSLRYENTDLTDLPGTLFLHPELRRARDSSTTISNTWSIERDTVDNSRDPSRGARHMISLEVAGLGGDNEFIKTFHDSTWYRPLNEKKTWVLSLRTREGWVGEYGSSDYVPLQDRFYAGGTSTVRGYDIRDIGPKVRENVFFGDKFAVGGNVTWIANLEVKYKITDNLRIYGFTDAGGVWREEDAFEMGDMRYSAGLGLGFFVPFMGPIRVDYGIPLNPDEDQGNGRLHLQTAFSF